MCACIYTDLCVCVYVHIHMCMCVFIRVHMCVYIYVCFLPHLHWETSWSVPVLLRLEQPQFGESMAESISLVTDELGKLFPFMLKH